VKPKQEKSCSCVKCTSKEIAETKMPDLNAATIEAAMAKWLEVLHEGHGNYCRG